MPSARVRRHGGDCDGELKRLYERRERPARGYVAVGWMCTVCNATTLTGAELLVDELDIADELAAARYLRRAHPPMAVPKGRRPTRRRK